MVASRTEQVSSNVHEFLVIICRISSIFRTLMSRIKITIFSGTPKILQLKFRRIVHLILEQNLLQKADHSIFHLVIALHSWPRVDRLSSFGSPIESLLPPSNSEGQEGRNCRQRRRAKVTKRCLPSLGTALPSLGTTSPGLFDSKITSRAGAWGWRGAGWSFFRQPTYLLFFHLLFANVLVFSRIFCEIRWEKRKSKIT